jgi:glycine cleavage system H protein
MNVPDELFYTSTHEWVLIKGDTATVGITDFAQAQLSDLTFVELPAVGDELTASDEVGVVESVKAASDVYAPVSGTVTAINAELEKEPGLVNSDPFGEGWLFRIRLSDSAEVENLLTAEAYREAVPDED